MRGELAGVRTWAAVIETVAGLVIAGYCTAACSTLLRRLDRRKAQSLVAGGALTGLSFIVCATLLKALLITSWQQIGIFACVFALRTALKRIFSAEEGGNSRGDLARNR